MRKSTKYLIAIFSIVLMCLSVSAFLLVSANWKSIMENGLIKGISVVPNSVIVIFFVMAGISSFLSEGYRREEILEHPNDTRYISAYGGWR